MVVSRPSNTRSTAAAGAQSRRITRVANASATAVADRVVVEEPLEIRVVADGQEWPVTVTMRTPGADAELAAGFLFAEAVIAAVDEIDTITPCEQQPNLIRVALREGCLPRLDKIARNFAATSSCGLCGKTSIDSVFANFPQPLPGDAGPRIDPAVLENLPARLREAQAVFDRTGGLHAVAAFTADGTQAGLFEDVGRHNAFDKLVGATLLAGRGDLRDRIVLLSGRAGFEMLQKAAMARAPILAAIGAPTSLAIDVAERAGITLVGFLRSAGFNVYSHPQRIAGTAGDQNTGR